MVELLKQPQYVPMDVFDQIVSIFAGSSGMLDDVEVKKVAEFESKMHEYLKSKHAKLRAELREKKVIEGDLKERFVEAIKRFKDSMKS